MKTITEAVFKTPDQRKAFFATLRKGMSKYPKGMYKAAEFVSPMGKTRLKYLGYETDGVEGGKVQDVKTFKNLRNPSRLVSLLKNITNVRTPELSAFFKKFLANKSKAAQGTTKLHGGALRSVRTSSKKVVKGIKQVWKAGLASKKNPTVGLDIQTYLKLNQELAAKRARISSGSENKDKASYVPPIWAKKQFGRFKEYKQYFKKA